MIDFFAFGEHEVWNHAFVRLITVYACFESAACWTNLVAHSREPRPLHMLRLRSQHAEMETVSSR